MYLRNSLWIYDTKHKLIMALMPNATCQKKKKFGDFIGYVIVWICDEKEYINVFLVASTVTLC